MLVPTSEREKTKKYEKLWIKIRDLVRAITKNSDGYEENWGWEFRYLVLFYYGLFNKIYDKIKYLMSELVVLRIVLIIFFGKIRID